jgi:hypothetical protein
LSATGCGDGVVLGRLEESCFWVLNAYFSACPVALMTTGSGAKDVDENEGNDIDGEVEEHA